MRKQRHEIEIMAPVGNFESLMAAVNAKANSVYFGVEQLNMRAKSANNFTLADLPEISRICNENNIKTYLALNTIIYDHDLKILQKLITEARKHNISAIIASDHAVLNYAKEAGLPIHISTQLNISNVESVKFYAQFADVIVLARELTLQQTKHIAEQIEKQNITGPSGEKIRLELFAHGALCMAISGKCYLSLHEQNASANRGACLQTCRKAYKVTDLESGNELEIDNEYIMSPKDLMTLNFLPQVLDAGISVLKIEGRARPGEYVKTTVECYSEAVDAVFENSFTPEKIQEWTTRLSRVFNRGFWDGYYLGRKLGEWTDSYGSKATHQKMYVGKGQNYFEKLKVAEILMEAGELCVGDEIIVSGPTTGVIETTVKEIRFELHPVEKAKQGQIISVPIEQKVRKSDKIYKIIKAK